MAKIVYLFGAGASANALPVVNQVSYRIRQMVKKLPLLEAKENAHHPCKKEDLVCLSNELKWLHEVVGNHATMDTLAKKLWVQKNQVDYKRLRFAIAAYFILEQAYGKPDRRYDTFWASLYGEEGLPKNVSILSWNYDSQFEITYHDLGVNQSGFMDSIQVHLQMDINKQLKADRFNILKLNGTALLSKDKSSVNPFWGREKMSVANYIHTHYIGGIDSRDIWNPLSFSWDTIHSPTLEPFIEPRVNDAEILVVIGYSFPFFNRATDRKIIESMPNLKKIYFQDMRPDNVANAFRAISNKKFEIEKIDYVDQFFLPYEL